MATVISVTNQKGGVGKTTTAVNLAFYLAKNGKKTLLIDLDPQGNATSGFGINKGELIYTSSEVMTGVSTLESATLPTEYKNLFIVPTVPALANTEAELAQAERRFSRLKTAVLADQQSFDYIIIDNPPSLSLLTINGLIASNFILLPVQTEFYALEGLGQLLETVKLIRKGMNPTLDIIGVLPTMVDARTVLSSQVHDEIKKHFPGKVFKTVIPRNIRVAEAPSHGVPIGIYDKFSKGARAYKSLTKEVLKRVEG